MNDHFLSPEEIKELINDPNGADKNIQITKEEIDALGEIGNISIGTSATTLYSLLKNKVVITTPKVSITTIKKLKEAYPIPFISVEVSYTKGINGSTLMIMKEEDAKIIADLMMGGDGRKVDDLELYDIRMSAVGEAMNQMMGSAATSLSIMLKKDISISPPTLTRVDLAADSLKGYFDENEDIVDISFTMEVGDFLKSEIMQLMPITFAKRLAAELYSLSMGETVPEESPASGEDTDTDLTANSTYNNEPPKKEPQPNKPIKQEVPQKSKAEEHSANTQNQNVTVKPVEFHPLQEEAVFSPPSSLDLILDVPLEVTVELGRTEKTVKEILEISSGTIIELDKMAGEPADILVNGKLIAKGEVVVIDENFGVRITEIINSVDRVKSLQ